MRPTFNIAVIAGDGIGPEVIAEAERILRRAQTVVDGFELRFEPFEAGAACYLRTGNALPDATVAAARAADAILLGACGLPDVRYPDGTELVPQIELRSLLDLYAGIRPIRGLPGVPPILARCPIEAIDFVIVRENTEGLFASRAGGIVLGDAVAADTQVITRTGTARVVHAAFACCRARREEAMAMQFSGENAKRRRERRTRRGIGGEDSPLPSHVDSRSSPTSPIRVLPAGKLSDPEAAARRGGTVTCVDKANVFRSFAFFRRVFDEVAEGYRSAGIQANHCYVDAMALRMVRDPASLDVLVAENFLGDILSDLGAGLVGGLGMAPSADIGDKHALFQPVHGTAPDIAGRGIANPIAAILSAAMLLDWLGSSRACPAARAAAARIDAAVRAALAEGVLPPDLGGTAGTGELGKAVERLIR